MQNDNSHTDYMIKDELNYVKAILVMHSLYKVHSYGESQVSHSHTKY